MTELAELVDPKEIVRELLEDVWNDGDMIAGPSDRDRRAAAAIERLERERDEASQRAGNNAALWHEACEMVNETRARALTAEAEVQRLEREAAENAIANSRLAEQMERTLAELGKVREALRQHEKLLCINAVRDAARQTAPLWLEAADAAAYRDRARVLSEPDKEGML